MQLSIQTWVTFAILAVVMGLNNIYSTLLTGWGDGGSIVAVILCVIFLAKRDANIVTYNLGQTMASAGGSVGFTTAIIASIYVAKPDWAPPLMELGLLVMAISLLGVLLSVPLRKYIVHWFFPGAVACGTILEAVTSQDQGQRKRARNVMGFSGIVSAILTFPTKVAFTKGGAALWSSIPLGKVFGISMDPLLYGIGLVVGPRIGISMLISSAFAAFYFIPELAEAKANVGDVIKWTAVGLMTLPAFVSMGLALKWKSDKRLPSVFTPRDETLADRLNRKQITWLVVLGVMMFFVTAFTMNDLFGVHWGYVIAGLALGMPLCVMLGRVASETDINPVRLIAIVLLAVFALFGTHSPVALLAMGICGAALASIAVDLFYDLRTGYLIGANPKHQVLLQLLGVVAVSFVAVFFLHELATDYGFGEGKYFPAPGAVVWATMAEGFSKGTGAFSSIAMTALIWSSMVGIVLAVLEAWPKTRPYTPSAFAMGIGLLLPGDMAPAILIGGLARWGLLYWARKNGTVSVVHGVNQKEEQMMNDAFQGGSAIFAAAALTGIVAILLITFGVVYLPA